jgi:hypothetical protein
MPSSLRICCSGLPHQTLPVYAWTCLENGGIGVSPIRRLSCDFHLCWRWLAHRHRKVQNQALVQPSFLGSLLRHLTIRKWLPKSPTKPRNLETSPPPKDQLLYGNQLVPPNFPLFVFLSLLQLPHWKTSIRTGWERYRGMLKWASRGKVVSWQGLACLVGMMPMAEYGKDKIASKRPLFPPQSISSSFFWLHTYVRQNTESGRLNKFNTFLKWTNVSKRDTKYIIVLPELVHLNCLTVPSPSSKD